MRSRYLRLLLATLVIVTVWCGVLPHISRTDRVQRRIEWLDTHGIDPSAMYYTELPVMDRFLNKRDAVRPVYRER